MGMPSGSRIRSCLKPTLGACVLCTLWMLVYYSLTTSHFHVISRKNVTSETDSESSRPGYLSNSFPPLRKVCLDVHIDDEGHVHSECTPHHGNQWGDPKKQIAIGGGITSTGLKLLDRNSVANQLPLFTAFIPGFCRTCSEGYHYHFYLGHDAVDNYFSEPKYQQEFTQLFYDSINEKCSKSINVTLHLVLCNHHKKPAWAQNDAMVEAYIDNMEYFYRVNDDTDMQASGWTEAFIDVLGKYSPPNVGVVGPKHSGGNEGILTYDFTHKTHIEIFGFHYPRELTDWWADDWVTFVYQPGRSTKLQHIPLVHTLQMGQRYATDHSKGGIIGGLIDRNKLVLKRYVEYRETKDQPVADGTKVIAVSLYGRDTANTHGAIRNAQIVRIFYPGWTLRFYIPSPESKSELLVPERILYRLGLLGAEFVHVKSSAVNHVPPALWSLLIADNKTVEYFLIRSVAHRFSDRESAAVKDWLKRANDFPFHCMRDNEQHISHPIVSGLWGSKGAEIVQLLGKSMSAALQEAVGKSVGSELSEQQFVSDTLWPAVKDKAMCHDSVSCNKWPHSVAFPSQRTGEQFVGQRFDAYSTALDSFSLSPEGAAVNQTCTGI